MKIIKREIVFGMLMLFLTGVISMPANVVKNEDNPLKGQYVFPMEEVWATQEAGEDLFGLLVEIAVGDSGNIYCRDLKNRVYYIFDSRGRFIKRFGEQGEAPGRVQQPGGASVLVHKESVLLEDAARILYFDSGGNYIRSVQNNRFTRPITILLSEDEFISAPTKLANVQKGNAKVKYVNLKTNKERMITDFTLFNSGVLNRTFREGTIQANATIPTITPVMVIGHHENHLYFGMNSTYEIFITDMQGKAVGTFSLERKPKRVTLQEREEVMLRLVKGIAPPEVARQIARTLPDKETCFVNIEIINGLIYVARSHFPAGHQQQIDIFSREGKYIYKSFVRLAEGTTIIAGPVFRDGHLFLAWEDEEGEAFLGKFKTSMPE